MSDYAELVKRLRSIRWTGMVEAADAIEVQAATMSRLSARLEAEVRASHVLRGPDPGGNASCGGCEWRHTKGSGLAADKHAAHVNEAVAEALGGRP